MPAEPRSWIRLAVLAGALALGTWLRLRGLASLPLTGDEYHTLAPAPEFVDLSQVSYGSLLTRFDAVGSHVALPLLQRLSLDLFGAGIVPFRLVAIVPGLLLLLMAYPLLRAFGSKDAAALASAALALNPMVVYYSRFARGYALALLLALGLGWAVRRVLEPGARTRWTWSVLVLCGTLLPWVHLSTVGFVLALALAGTALALRGSRATAAKLAAAFALAATLAALLFLPVLGQVVEYFRAMESEPPPLSWFGVPTLLAGGRISAALWLAALALGVPLAWRERRAGVVLALAALAGPLALLLATNPRGMDYAWARYLLSALPFLAALAAAGLMGLSLRLVRSERPALLLGAALLLLQHWTGPLGPRAPRDGAFSNTYLALHPLAAFDEPYPATSEFYRALAQDPVARCIVEVPDLKTRAVLLYRNYALQHGKRVLVGWTGELQAGIRNGPYVRLLELEPGQADYIVLHKDQASEVPEYFRFVYEEAWPRLRDPADDTFMRRQETIYPQNLLDAAKTAPLAARLQAVHGPAHYKDERILVWKLAH
jgi:hypothetical protein